MSIAKGIVLYGGPRKTGIQPARKISVSLLVLWASPASTKQNTECSILWKATLYFSCLPDSQSSVQSMSKSLPLLFRAFTYQKQRQY